MISYARATKTWRPFTAGVVLWCAMVSVAAAAEPSHETLEAFARYVRDTEARLQDEIAGGAFLWVDRLPARERQAAYAQLRRGRIIVERLETRDHGEPIKVPNGLVHHWVGLVFMPATTLQQTLALVQDYDHHQDVYRPVVRRSHILRHQGNEFQVYRQLFKKKLITIVLNTEHHVRYEPLDATRVDCRATTTHIAEVENVGTAAEREKPSERARGYLWRLNSYSRFQEKDGGTYMQYETVSLSREIPLALRWLVSPFLRSVPKDILTSTLQTTRRALVASGPGSAR